MKKKAINQEGRTADALIKANISLGKVWLEKAGRYKQEGNSYFATMAAGRAIGYEGFGREKSFSSDLNLEEDFPILIDKSRSPDLFQQAKKEIITYVGATRFPVWFSPNPTDKDYEINQVFYSPDGTQIGSLDSQDMVKIWDSQTGQLVMSFKDANSDSITAACFSSDGLRIFSGHKSGAVATWTLNGGFHKEPASAIGHEDEIKCMALSGLGTTLITGCLKGNICVWRTEQPLTRSISISAHDREINSIAISPDASILASAGNDSTVKFWSSLTGQQVGDSISWPSTSTIAGEPDYQDSCYSVKFSPDGSELAAGGGLTGSIFIISSAEQEIIRKLPDRHNLFIYDLAFHPDGNSLASASHDGNRPILESSQISSDPW